MSDERRKEAEAKTIDVDLLRPVGFNLGHFTAPDKARAVADGRCVNLTGEKLAVYGPKHPDDPSTFDNSLYVLPTGYQTPDDWDCDGVYVPNDRIADQFVGSDIQGPVAIKYVGVLTFTITKTGSKYNFPANQGAFLPNEVCCPSNYPTCVCWPIPNIPQSVIENQ